ncbi:hypothetical protein BDF22DRAFT_739749 [Syncephalis plumigaleata]|nr:hypothetical protein BDF22DRAFT_739749 [Syncephalis plumigaleata]
MEKHKEFGLSAIGWRGGNTDQLRLAHVIWNNQAGFMKCDQVSSKEKGSKVDVFRMNIAEVDAFRALMTANNSLTGDYATGRENVMDPLYQFGFNDSNGNKYFCHIYSYINGETLNDYFRGRTIFQMFIAASQILPEVIKGLVYLYNAGVIHGDMHPRNIMLQLDPGRRIVGVKIIDLDVAKIFRKEQGWRPINPMNEAYLSSDPPQQYASCNQLKNVIAKYLGIFVILNERENPYDPNYVVTEQVVLDYLKEFQEDEDYVELELGNVKAAIPTIHYLLKVDYVTRFSPSVCTFPLRILREQPPRIGTSSRPNNPTFQW